MRHGEKPMQREFFETVIYKCGNDFTHDPEAPEFLAEPVTKLSGVAMNILTSMKSDGAHQGAVDIDAKDLLGAFLRCDIFQKAFCIFDRVWIRKTIPQVDRNVAIIRVFRERLGIGQAAVPNRATLELEFHENLRPTRTSLQLFEFFVCFSERFHRELQVLL